MFVAKALGFAQPDTVDDGSVVEGIRDDGVFLPEKRLEYPTVGVEGSRIQNGVLGAQKLGQLPLQLLVDVLSAANKPHRRHAIPVGINGLLSGLNHLGVR